MERKIHISKVEGATVVEVTDNTSGIANITSYDAPYDFRIVNQNIVVYGEFPILTFSFSEIDNPLGATNIEEYFDVMTENKFFVIDQEGGSGDFKFTEDIAYSLPTGKSFGRLVGTGIYPAVGKNVQEVLQDIALEYLTPTFSSFSMQGQATSVEIGTVLSGSKNFTFGFTYGQNVEENSLSILDVTADNILAADLPKTSPQSVNIGSISKSNPNTTHQWRAIAINTLGNTLQSGLFTVNFVLRRFFGSTSSPTTNSAQARALAQNVLDNTSNTFNLNTGSANKIFEVLIPATKSIVQVNDIDALNANITANYILIDNNFMVNDIGGTPRAYKLYRMTIQDTYSDNHRHQIQIS